MDPALMSPALRHDQSEAGGALAGQLAGDGCGRPLGKLRPNLSRKVDLDARRILGTHQQAVI